MDQGLRVFLERMKGISSMVLHASQASDLPDVLDRIAQGARELTDTRYAALGIPDGKGSLRYFRTTGMTEAEIAMMDHLPRGHGLIGAIMAEQKVIRLENMAADPRSSGFPPDHPPMTSFLGVPVEIGGRLFGMLYLCDKQDGTAFTDADVQLVQTMASYAAVAISGADMAAQSRQIQLLEERERIGMALHDGVIQSLYGLGMKIEFLRGSPVQAEDFDGIIDGLNDVIDDIRGFILQLRRSASAPTLREVLQHVMRRLNTPTHVQVQLQVSDTICYLSPAEIESLMFVVQEALSNALRHANADQISITAGQHADQLCITVQDNGQGFDIEHLSPSSTGGLGLANMQRRVGQLKGSLTIDSAPDTGTQLAIMVPHRYIIPVKA